MRPLSQTLQCCLKLGRALSVALILGLPLNSGLAASGTDGQSCADASAKPSSEELFKEVDGYRVFKIQIVGKQVGAYRVYGCLMNGVFEFVLWEHEGTHDDRYISRVTQKTADICKRL